MRRIQLAALGPIQKHFSNQVSNSVSDFTNSIARSINGAMREDSAAYASLVNAQTTAMQTTINDNMFGWVNSTTVTLNNTIGAFYNDIQSTVDLVFGGTILENPAREFVRCIIGSKVEGLEKALTFIHDNLRVNMPTVSDDVLLLSNSSVSEITQPISLAAVGDGTSDSSGGGIIGKVIARYVASLEKERFMYFIFLGLWGFVVLVALCIVLWHTLGARWLHERRQRAWEQGRSFGPFSRRPSEQSRYAFPNVPGGGASFGMLHATALDGGLEKGRKSGLMRLFGSSGSKQEQMPSPKWAEGQNVQAMVHIQGGDNWVGRLKSALGRKKAETQAAVNPYDVPKEGSVRLDRSKVNPDALAERQDQQVLPTWPEKQSVGSNLPTRNEPRLSSETARSAASVLPAHMTFSSRTPSPPATPPGLPRSPAPANAYLARQAPPMSTIPGGRVPQSRRHHPQMSPGNANPFATPFDEDRASTVIDGRHPTIGHAF